MNAIAGLFDESRIANCVFSKVQPRAVHSFSAFSMSYAVTMLNSTILYLTATQTPDRVEALYARKELQRRLAL